MNSEKNTLVARSLVVGILVLTAGAACSSGSDDLDAANSALASGVAGPIVSAIESKCLDDFYGQTINGNKVQLYTCNKSNAQNWVYTNDTFVGPGGKCLDIESDNQVPGAVVQLYQCNGTNAQKWTVSGKAIKSTKGLCLDVTGANAANGTQIQLYTCNGNPSQQWTVGGGTGGTGGGTGGSGGVTKTLYVSGTGSDANDGNTPSSPLRTVGAAARKTAPGYVVQVDNGTYDGFTVSIAGTPSAWIRYVAKEGAKPKIHYTGWNGIYIASAQYIEIRGFEVEGPMASKTLAECQKDAKAATPDPLCNGNGISVDSRGVTNKAHHILIDGNEVHDAPGGGISAIAADYITIDGNSVHDNCFHNRYGASGISLLTSWNFDRSTDVKSIISHNLVFGNKNEVEWVQIGALSDGNGIIIDTSRNDPPAAAYTGRFLVANNVSVGNGGSGMHAYKSDHVDFFYNTTYQNGQVVGYPELFANNSNDVRIENNVIIGRSDGAVNSKDSRSAATYDYNIYYGGTVASKGPHDVVADPRVVKPSLDRAVANFRLAAGSPAIDTANPAFTASSDVTGAARPVGNGHDRGAYEFGSGR